MLKALLDWANGDEHGGAGYWLVCRMEDGRTVTMTVEGYGDGYARGKRVLTGKGITDDWCNPSGGDIAVNERHVASATIDWGN